MEHQILRSDYAGIRINDNAGATDVALVDSWEMVKVFNKNSPSNGSTPDQANDRIIVAATADYRCTFNHDSSSAGAAKIYEASLWEISPTEIAITGLTNADPVVVTTTAAHGLSNGQKVRISGVTTMTEVNDRIFTIQDKAATTFELTDDGGASPANDIDGTGFAGAGTGGIAQVAVELDIHSHRVYGAGGDIGSSGDNQFEDLTIAYAIEMAIKNLTNADDLTVEHASITIERVG